MKRALPAVFGLVLALLMTACGTGSSPPAGEEPPPAAQEAAEALDYFSGSKDVAVYRDSDGSSVEELMSAPQVPKQSLPTPAKEPLSFGATVGAVVVGFVAIALASLLLSLL